MKKRRNERPDDDEIAMRYLSVKDPPAMGESEALVSWRKAHPGE